MTQSAPASGAERGAGWLAGPDRPVLTQVTGPPAEPGRPAHPGQDPVVVCAASGGAGATVVSGLLADFRAAAVLGEHSWWVDASVSDGDLPARMRVQLDVGDTTATTTVGAQLWRPGPTIPVTDIIDQVTAGGGVPVVDAGACAVSLLPELTQGTHWTPVLVIEPRPDLLNRARTVLSAWHAAGVLARAVLVIDCQIPTLNHAYLSRLVTDAVVGRVSAVVGLDYDAQLGGGGALDRDGQEQLSGATWSAIDALAAATGPAAPQAVAR